MSKDVRRLEISPATPILGTMSVSPLVLRAAPAGEEMSDADKAELLARSMAGEHVEIHVDIESFNQIEGVSNKNHVRFRKAKLSAIARTGVGSVFLRDHAQSALDARGGTITRSKAEKVDGGVVFRQTVHAVEPWAVQGFLKGKIDRFSIGWHPTEQVTCSACKASVRECYHWPGDTVELKSGPHTVEYIFEDAELVETSAVNVPAVSGTGVDNIRAALGLSTIPRGKHMEEETKEGAGKAGAEQNQAATRAATQAAIKAERERSAAIRRTGKALGLSDELVQKHLEADTSASDFNALAIETHADANSSPLSDHGRPHVDSGESSKEKIARAARDWMIHRAGRHQEYKDRASKSGDEYINDGGGQFKGMTLMEMARHLLRADGVRVESLTATEIIRRTLSAGYQTRSEFPVALEGVLRQEVLAKYEQAADTWRRLARVGSHTDFRPTAVYRRGSFGALDDHIEGEEIKRKKIADAVRELIKLKTKANIVEVTREVMIDDNLGLVMDQAGDLGMAAGLSIELDFYALIQENGGLGPIMSDGKTLLHPDHKNIAPSSALSINAIDQDAALFAEQTDITGQVLALEPSILLIPRSQRGLARKINRSTNDFSAGEQVEAPNPVEGQFSDIIATTRIKSLAPRRYTLAALAAAEVFRVVFLNGQQNPMLDREEGFRTLGTSWRIVFDYQVGAVAWEGIQTNAGA